MMPAYRDSVGCLVQLDDLRIAGLRIRNLRNDLGRGKGVGLAAATLIIHLSFNKSPD